MDARLIPKSEVGKKKVSSLKKKVAEIKNKK